MDSDEFRVERTGAFTVVTLQRPQKGNSISAAGARALADLFDDLSSNTDARAVLLRAEGKHFCTGADLSGAQGDRPVNGHMVRSLAASHHRAISALFHCRIPVVAAVHGGALGFGLHLALAADFVIAGEGASFTEPFADRGFALDSGGSWLLTRLVGLSRAKQMVFLADRVDAATALAWGLITDVVPDDQLDTVARDWAARLASRPTQALAASKRLLHDALGTGLDQALHAESMAVELTIRSDDFKAGMAAFADRRRPDFTGT